MRGTLILGSALLFLGATSSTASAGGLGVIGTGGLHTAKAYYYDENGEQGIDPQVRPNAGFGIEGLLGSRDDRIIGLFRAYLVSDAPIATPDTAGLDPSTLQMPDYASLGWNSRGAMTMGVQWGLYGDPESFELTLTTLVGSGFVTRDSTEFLLADVGPGVTWNINQNLQLMGELSATARYRKGFSWGGNAVAGLRYLFD